MNANLWYSDKCPHLISNLEDIKVNVNKYSWDFPAINWGIEGSGKTKFTCWKGHYLDEHFNIKQVAFSPEQIDDRLENSDRGQVVIIDEGGEYFFSRDWNKLGNKGRVQNMFILRHKGLIILINIPDIDYLDVYLRTGRLRYATRTWTMPIKQKEDDGTVRVHRERGYFSLYTRKSIVNTFTKGYTLYPAFSEMYPDLEDWSEGKKFWREYDALSKAYKQKLQNERLKIKEENEDKEEIKNARKFIKGVRESRFFAERAASELESVFNR